LEIQRNRYYKTQENVDTYRKYTFKRNFRKISIIFDLRNRMGKRINNLVFPSKNWFYSVVVPPWMWLAHLCCADNIKGTAVNQTCHNFFYRVSIEKLKFRFQLFKHVIIMILEKKSECFCFGKDIHYNYTLYRVVHEAWQLRDDLNIVFDFCNNLWLYSFK